jgi:maltose O-acetyltransferase
LNPFSIIESQLEKIPEIRYSLLRKKGLNLGRNVFLASTVTVDRIFPYLITIADECTIADGTVILAHDASTKGYFNYSKVGKVYIGKNTFIGANCVILPNITIGSNVIVAAGSIVSSNLPNGVVAAGAPAKILCTTEEYIKKHKERLNTRLFDISKKEHVLRGTDKYGLIYTS